MLQIPVLAPPTGWAEFTHSICCAKFAEFQGTYTPVASRCSWRASKCLSLANYLLSTGYDTVSGEARFLRGVFL
jgi:hypothetical protein